MFSKRMGSVERREYGNNPGALAFQAEKKSGKDEKLGSMEILVLYIKLWLCRNGQLFIMALHFYIYMNYIIYLVLDRPKNVLRQTH
jgi:hypothetical protein